MKSYFFYNLLTRNAVYGRGEEVQKDVNAAQRNAPIYIDFFFTYVSSIYIFM